MVPKSKLANKQRFKKVAKKAAKTTKPKANAKKTQRKQQKPLPAPPPIQDVEPESDQGEDMLDMVDEDDLSFLRHAIDNRSYSILHKVKYSEKRKRKLVHEDDDQLENEYENETKDVPKKKVKSLLPIKTKQGVVKRTTTTTADDEDQNSDDEEQKMDTENGEEDAEEDDDDEDDGEYILEDSNLDLSKPITPAQLLLTRSEILLNKQIHIGTLCSGLLENPEEKITNLRTLLKLLDDFTPEVYITTRKLVIVALLEVFKDLLPSYEIKLQDIQNVKLKKDTLKLHKFEETLLQYYKKYLQKLEKFAEVLYKKRGDNRVRTKGELNIGEVAVHAMCDLLVAHPYFNFAPNLVQAVVPFLNSSIKAVRLFVSAAMKTIFKEDKKEEITLKILRVINHYLKNHSHNVNIEMLEIMLALRLKEVNLDQEKDIEIKQKKQNAHKQNILTKLSKRDRKRKKRLQDLEKEMLETKAEENKQTKAQNLTEITKILFGIYFRILKSSTNRKILSVCLEGLAKYAHCINLEYYVDIVNVLDKLMAEDWMGHREKLLCIQTVFAILSGQGSVLNIDPTRFYVHLYTGIQELGGSCSSSDFEILLPTLMAAIIQRRTQITNKRLLGFVKRIATMALHLTRYNAVLACLCIIKMILQKNKAAHILLDMGNGCGDGRYDPNMNDPEYCNASNTALFEMLLLMEHYHPIVRIYAKHIAHGAPATGEGSLPVQYGILSPEELYTMFDASQMAFNPPIAVPKKVPRTTKPFKHTFIDQDLKRLIDEVIAKPFPSTSVNFYGALKKKPC